MPYYMEVDYDGIVTFTDSTHRIESLAPNRVNKEFYDFVRVTNGDIQLAEKLLDNMKVLLHNRRYGATKHV